MAQSFIIKMVAPGGDPSSRKEFLQGGSGGGSDIMSSHIYGWNPHDVLYLSIYFFFISQLNLCIYRSWNFLLDFLIEFPEKTLFFDLLINVNICIICHEWNCLF